MKIAVLYGGVSGEREVSLSTGEGVMKALEANGHDVIGIDFNPNRLEEIINLDVDLVFIGLHGKYGEDGSVQGLLDMLNIPYVGSGVVASSLAMDKAKAKQIFKANGIPTAKANVFHIHNGVNIEQLAIQIEEDFDFPLVVKPNQEGSTLGLTIVKESAQLISAIDKASKCDAFVLVEQFIAGKELTVPVQGKIGEEEALPIIEIIPKNDLYDYEAKYTEGASEYIIPARIDEELTKLIQAYAITAHQVLGCETYSRADFILTEDNIPYILEVNTLPGMTPTSLFPDAAKKVGLTYEEMIETFIKLSIK